MILVMFFEGCRIQRKSRKIKMTKVKESKEAGEEALAYPVLLCVVGL